MYHPRGLDYGAPDAWGMNQFSLESFTSSSWNTDALKIHIIWLTGLLFICSFTHVACGGVSVCVCVACDSTPPSATLCLGGVLTSWRPQALTLPSLWNATPQWRPAMSCVRAPQSSERHVLIHSPIMPSYCSLTKSGRWPLLLHAPPITMWSSTRSITVTRQ